MKQLELLKRELSQQIQPSSERTDPTLWIRRLVVLRELSLGEEHEVRSVTLRPGFNIVWAPHRLVENNALFENGVAGHTAGKTTFCRFLRYVLGEAHFATAETTRRIREVLPSGWVVAEVVLERMTWVVARPLSIGPRSLAIRGGTIEKMLEGKERDDYQTFLDEVEAATLGPLAVSQLPAGDSRVQWGHLLAWLSRDQDCRFADFLEWRHQASDSESPELSRDGRSLLVRSVLGLISAQEREQLDQHSLLVSRRKQAVQRRPLFEHQAKTDHGRLERALGRKLSYLSAPVFREDVKRDLGNRTKALDEREAALEDTNRSEELWEALQTAMAAENDAKRNLAETKRRHALDLRVLGELSGELKPNPLADLPPPRDFCEVRMDVARREGCPLATFRPEDFGAKKAERTAKEELEHQRALVRVLEEQIGREQQAFEEAANAAKAARFAYLSASTRLSEAKLAIAYERAQLVHLERLVSSAVEAQVEEIRVGEEVAELEDKIRSSEARLNEIRSLQRSAVARFSETFGLVVRALLGNDIKARVETSGRSLALFVEEHGNRESAAITTLKLLAFDLASLISSVEGHGDFPRFLIHDGPREADLSPDIYARLFLLAQEIEHCFSETASFQYVLTTTTQPPEGFREEPWLRLELAGIPAEERFLKCDL